METRPHKRWRVVNRGSEVAPPATLRPRFEVGPVLRRATRQLENFIITNPEVSLVVAACLGFTAGWWIKRR